MEMMIKMSFAITLILAAVMNIVIIYFTNDLLKAKNNVTVYEGHINFRKEVTKSSQLAGYNFMSKIQRFGYCNCNVSASKFSNIDIHKKIQTYQKLAIKSFKNLALPIFWSFFASCGNYCIKRQHIFCVFIWLICLSAREKKQSGTCIFVHKMIK